MSQNTRAVIGLVVISTIVGTCYAVASGPVDDSRPPAAESPLALEVSVGPDVSDADRGRIRLASEFVAKSCSPLARARRDIVRVDGKVEEAFGYFHDQVGWDRAIWLQVHLADSPREIPADFHAWGHVCHFALGGGRTPGMFVSKRPCMRLCGLSAVEAEVQSEGGGARYFVSGPELTALD